MCMEARIDALTVKSQSAVMICSPAPARVNTWPQGSMTAEWPPYWVCPAVPQAFQQATNIWFSMARAWVSTCKWGTRTSGHWDTMNSISSPGTVMARVSSGKRMS